MSASVSVVLIRPLADVLQQRGIAPAELLGHGYDVWDTEGLERRISLAEYQSLFSRAVKLTGDPALALCCGFQAAESSFGLVTPLISHAQSLRHALQLVAQFQPLLLDQTCIQLSEHMGTASVRCDFPRTQAAADCCMAELIVAGLARTLRSFGCAPQELEAVCFEFSRPAHHQAFQRVFAGTERFQQAFTGIRFAASALDRPHIHRHRELQTLLREQAERKLACLGGPMSRGEQVRALMRGRRDGHTLEMEVAARALGLSVRSLRRRLIEEGTSYRAVAQSVLQEDACALLRDPSTSLQVIAGALGFADLTTFGRAFKRWTRVTPAEYRESCLRKRSAQATSQ